MVKRIGAVGCSGKLVLFFSVLSSRCSLFTNHVELSSLTLSSAFSSTRSIERRFDSMRVEARSVEPSSLCVLYSLRSTLCVLSIPLRSFLLRFTNAELSGPRGLNKSGEENQIAS